MQSCRGRALFSTSCRVLIERKWISICKSVLIGVSSRWQWHRPAFQIIITGGKK